MFIAVPAPSLAVHAPTKSCTDGKPQDFSVAASAVLRSPDCRWLIAYKADSDRAPDIHLNQPLADNIAVVANHSTAQVVASFSMERSASVYWLEDRRHVIVNYFEGSGSTRPIAILLPQDHSSRRGNAVIDLAKLLYPDVLKRIHKRSRQVYHYYVYFVEDRGNRIVISALPEFVINGDSGPGDGRCLIYSIDKTTFRYRFVRGWRDTDEHPCPQNRDEHRD